MKCRFNKNLFFHSKGFTLAEAMAALTLLGLICGSILVIVNRCMATAADEVLRMQAFEVARDNMEKILAMDSVPELVDYGQSEKYPNIRWETTVETFYEPVASRIWFQALCTSKYFDSNGEEKEIEFTHWLGGLSQEQLEMLLKRNKTKNDPNTYFIKNIVDAAMYVDVDEETIKEWIENGMPMVDEKLYSKGQLDLYRITDGKPTPEEVAEQQKIDEEILESLKKKQSEKGREPAFGDIGSLEKSLDDMEMPTDVKDDILKMFQQLK